MKIRKRIIHFRLQPIRVFCLHQISDVFNPLTCYPSDWIQTESFRKGVSELKKDYTFISLSEAYRKISHDWLRLKKYAVLTFDDGYASILPSLEWLKEQQISYSLFLNAKYLDGYSCSAHILDLSKESEKSASTEGTVKGLYFTVENLNALPNDLSEFGSHGFEHIDSTALSPSSFIEQIGKCLEVINRWPQSIPFHAYTWGRHSASTDKILHDMGIIPVLMDGGKNYNDASCIHREEFPKP